MRNAVRFIGHDPCSKCASLSKLMRWQYLVQSLAREAQGRPRFLPRSAEPVLPFTRQPASFTRAADKPIMSQRPAIYADTQPRVIYLARGSRAALVGLGFLPIIWRVAEQARPQHSALFVRPEIPALYINDLAAVRAFHLCVGTNPADACPGLVVATRALHVDLEVVRLALCHRSPIPFCTGSAFVGNGLLRVILVRGWGLPFYCLRGQLRFFLGNLCFISLTAFVSIIRLHRHSSAPSG